LQRKTDNARQHRNVSDVAIMGAIYAANPLGRVRTVARSSTIHTGYFLCGLDAGWHVRNEYFVRQIPILNHAAILFWATFRVQIVVLALIFWLASLAFRCVRSRVF
jgi:hypothetical protein